MNHNSLVFTYDGETGQMSLHRVFAESADTLKIGLNEVIADIVENCRSFWAVYPMETTTTKSALKDFCNRVHRFVSRTDEP